MTTEFIQDLNLFFFLSSTLHLHPLIGTVNPLMLYGWQVRKQLVPSAVCSLFVPRSPSKLMKNNSDEVFIFTTVHSEYALSSVSLTGPCPSFPSFFPCVHLYAVHQYACVSRFKCGCVWLWLTVGIIMGPGCDVQRSSGSISKGKLLPAVFSNMSWFQGKQLEFWRSTSAQD